MMTTQSPMAWAKALLRAAIFRSVVKRVGWLLVVLNCGFSAAWAQSPTSTTLTVNPNPAYVGQSITLTATVTGSSPTGTVTFRQGSTVLGTGSVSGGQAIFTTSFASAATRNLTAVYGGDSANNTSTSAAVSLSVVAKIATTTALSIVPNPANVGQNITLTATVTGTSPSGTVTFKQGSTVLGTGSLSGGQATFTTSFATSGSRSLTAKYEGDTAYNTSTSSAVAASIVKASTATTITSDVNPAYVNQSITLTAAVSGNSPSGTVTFKSGSTTLGTGVINAGQATLATSFSTTGSKNLTARYDGDAANNTSTSSAVAQTVNAKSGSTTTLISSANPNGAAQTVTLTATVTGNNPTGTVSFRNGATTLGTATITSGQATFDTVFGTPGSYSVTAAYAGDVANNSSTSTALNQVSKGDTAVALSSNANPSFEGHVVTLTATVSGRSPTGTIVFRDGAATLGTRAISAGAASLNVSLSGVGNHSLTASYGGDLINNPSTSAAVAQVINATFPGALPSIPASVTPIVNYEYDAEGNQTKTVQAPGVGGFNFQSVSNYDRLSRVKESTNAKLGVTQFGYDGGNRLTQVIDPRSLVTQSPRDGLGQTTQLVSPDTGTASNTYDAAGNLKTRTDSRGAVAAYTYDVLNRLTQAVVTLPGRPTQTFGLTYDQTGAGFSNGIGRLTTASFPTGSTQYSHDGQGRILTETQHVDPTGGANSTQVATTVGYEYDNAGRPIGIVYPSGRKLVVTITEGAPSAVGLAASASTTPEPLITELQYAPFGRPQSWQWSLSGGSQLNERIYDTSGRLVRHRMGGSVRDIAYDAADRIVSFTHYDAVTAAAQPALNQAFGYDELGRLTAVTTSTASWTLAYDANGNRTGMTLNGGPSVYTVSGTSNRLESTTNPARSFSYDSTGNTTADTAGYTATYDASGRMETLTKAGATTTYSYNGAGQRVRKFSSTGPGSTTIFMYDQAGHILGEYDSTGVPIREYVWLDSTPLAVFTPNPASPGGPPLIYYFHTDHLNTPRVVTDTANNIRWRWMAEPFGTTAPETNPGGLGAFTQNLRFPGQYADSESGLFYNYFRDYDSTTGRYAQSDPIGLGGGINTYTYVGGNPLSFVDPNGLQAYTGQTPPAQVPGGPWTPAGPGQQPGTFYGPAKPSGPKDICRYVPDKANGGPNNTDRAYWKTQTPNQPWQRYDLNGNPITPEEAHPGNRAPFSPRLPFILCPLCTLPGVMPTGPGAPLEG